jgi:hypothetical protein
MPQEKGGGGWLCYAGLSSGECRLASIQRGGALGAGGRRIGAVCSRVLPTREDLDRGSDLGDGCHETLVNSLQLAVERHHVPLEMIDLWQREENKGRGQERGKGDGHGPYLRPPRLARSGADTWLCSRGSTRCSASSFAPESCVPRR